jgi:hypothetical protein
MNLGLSAGPVVVQWIQSKGASVLASLSAAGGFPTPARRVQLSRVNVGSGVPFKVLGNMQWNERDEMAMVVLGGQRHG